MLNDQVDAQRLARTLTECLSHSKRPLALLLGAGCPASIQVEDDDGAKKPLIPDIAGLTTTVNASASKSCSKYTELVLRLQEDLDRPPNIEEILSHIRGLAAIVGKHQVHGMKAETISQLEALVTAQITTAVEVALPTERTPYDQVASWAQAADRTNALKIFTTNYDLLLESAFERSSAPFFDGFVGAKEPFFDSDTLDADDLPQRWTRIFKLHGSSNWTVLQIIASFAGMSAAKKSGD